MALWTDRHKRSVFRRLYEHAATLAWKGKADEAQEVAEAIATDPFEVTEEEFREFIAESPLSFTPTEIDEEVKLVRQRAEGKDDPC